MSFNTDIKPQAAAFKLWAELGHLHPSEVEIEDLAFLRNILVKSGGVTGASGRLIRLNDRGLICYNNNIPYAGQRRFTIAHELGHWILHSEKHQFMLCNESDMRDYGKSTMEREANLFAAELLMPTTHFRPQAAALDPSIDNIQKLAKEFQTTLTATAIRFTDTSRKNIQVVWAENGLIKWSYMKKNSKVNRIRCIQLPQYSSATLPANQITDHMDHYDQADWFPNYRNSYEVMEQTIKMANLNASLTLLEVN